MTKVFKMTTLIAFIYHYYKIYFCLSLSSLVILGLKKDFFKHTHKHKNKITNLKILIPAPGAPTNLQITSVTADSISISYDEPSLNPGCVVEYDLRHVQVGGYNVSIRFRRRRCRCGQIHIFVWLYTL